MAGRIAVVIDPWNYPYNGTVVSTRRFVAALTQAGYEFQILSLAAPDLPGKEAFEKLSIPGFNRIIDTMRAPLARPGRAKLRSLLTGCDLLHVQYPFFLAHAAIGEARRLGIPVVCSFHVQPENILQNIRLPSRLLSNLLYRLFIRFIYSRADQVIAPSSFAAGLLTRHGLNRPVAVVSNGVPDRFFGVARSPRPEQGFLLLSVGRLAREKQQETLLHAVALSRHRADITVVLAGVGPRQAYLERLAARLKVNARIGWVDDEALLELHGQADLFVHTGTIELEGMSVLEAMATGNVVVVSDASASACAAMIHEAHARFRKGDSADLAERIDYWLARPEARAAQQRFNRLYAQSLSHDKVSGRLMSLYEEMLRETVTGLEPRMNGTS
ncbi:MAG: glycosyltransferase [Pseudomonadales bacterium]